MSSRLQLPNRIDFAVAFIALELLRAIANKVNPDFRTRELDYMLSFPAVRPTSSQDLEGL